MDTQLLINGFEVDLAERPTFPFSFSVVELTDLSKRSGASSKTITLPGTAVNQALFNSIFQLTTAQNPSLQSAVILDFDPSVKATAQVYQNGLLQFNGIAQLLSCKLSGGFWSFEVSLVSEVIDYVAKMQEVKINELDFSEYDHILRLENVSQTWAGFNRVNGSTTPINVAGNWLGIGYYYGLIDYGFQRPNATTWGVEQFPLQVFMYGILQKIFEKVGLTWNSDFLESQRFKKLALAYQGGELPTITAAQADDASAKMQQIYDGLYFLSGSSPGNIQQQVINGTPEFIIGFGQATFAAGLWTSIVQDNQSQVVTTYPMLFKAAVKGVFNVDYAGDHRIDFNFNLGGATIVGINGTYTMRAVIYKNNAVYSIEDIYTGAITSTALSQTYNVTFAYSKPISLNINDEVRVTYRLVVNITGIDLAGYSAVPIDYNVGVAAPGCTLDLIKQITQIAPNELVNLSAILPDMTGSDFFNGICKMFNLLVSPDQFIPTQLNIEPLIEYYKPTNEALSFTHKLDQKEQIEIVPSVNYASKQYIFRWADDDDYFNTDYKNKYDEQFGSFTVYNQSQYASQNTVYQLPFSQKLMADIPLDDSSFTGIIVPRCFSVQSGAAASTKKGKPFVVQIGAVREVPFSVIDEDGIQNDYTYYPYVGHLDNIDAPTFDLNFGVPDVVYWLGATYTQNNLYQYHEQFIKELVSRFGRLVKCSLRWNPADIYALDFRYLLQIDGVVYRLQKISDYNPTNDNSTKTELLKYIS